MKVVILAGGLGTRLIERTEIKPKPMVEIGGMPIIWHIMKLYSYYGFNDFVICLGYKGHIITEYFKSYFSKSKKIEIHEIKDSTRIISSSAEKWNIILVKTGEKTMTGGRIMKVKEYLENDRFFLTYGDGVSNVNIKELLNFHISNNKACTLTAVKPEPRFGALILEDNMVKHFREKDLIDVDWINGGYFVCEQSIFNYIKNGDKEVWEQAPLEGLSNSKNLTAFKHIDFWKPMDTLKDTIELNEMWDKNNAKWKIW